jgi:hypothetical protein
LEVVPLRFMVTRPTPGRPPPPPPTAVSVEHVETPKPITVSVDIPLKLDEGEINKPEPKLPERSPRKH